MLRLYLLSLFTYKYFTWIEIVLREREDGNADVGEDEVLGHEVEETKNCFVPDLASGDKLL